jgi:hypothetical protein
MHIQLVALTSATGYKCGMSIEKRFDIPFPTPLWARPVTACSPSNIIAAAGPTPQYSGTVTNNFVKET